MPHGTPDWGLVGPKETTFGLDDLGELAVRLGSPVQWDRRGDVVWWTIFDEGTSPVTITDAGAAGPTRLFTGESRQGAYSLKLTIQSLTADETEIEKFLPASKYSGLGLEFHFTTHGAEGIWEADLFVRRWDEWWRGRVRWDSVAGTLSYSDGTAIYPVFETGVKAFETDLRWHVMKLVIDVNARRYSRLILDSDEYDMGAYPLPGALLGGEPYWIPDIHYFGNGDDDVVDYVDSIIVTQNEP